MNVVLLDVLAYSFSSIFFVERVFFKTTSTKGFKNNLCLTVPDFWKSFFMLWYVICDFETKAKFKVIFFKGSQYFIQDFRYLGMNDMMHI